MNPYRSALADHTRIGVPVIGRLRRIYHGQITGKRVEAAGTLPVHAETTNRGSRVDMVAVSLR